MKRAPGFLLFLSALLVSSAVHAQEQPAPANNAEFTVDYPMDRSGVFVQNGDWTPVANQNPSKTKVGRGIAAALSYGAVSTKIIAEYQGEHAATQIDAAQPVFCLCHFSSIPGEPVLVRLHPKKVVRELDGGRMTVYPVVGNSKLADANKSVLVPVYVARPDSQVWLIRPKSPLMPGEYALMLGTQNVSIFPFTVMAAGTHP